MSETEEVEVGCDSVVSAGNERCTSFGKCQIRLGKSEEVWLGSDPGVMAGWAVEEKSVTDVKAVRGCLCEQTVPAVSLGPWLTGKPLPGDYWPMGGGGTAGVSDMIPLQFPCSPL